ncbi:biotin/lipoyl-binding protein [Arcobacteraceae bacterium]|nr:biotin/lipoyl-binding protein [Arcobacteraceae bacterium]
MEEIKKVREYSNKKSRFKIMVIILFLFFSISAYLYFSLKETIDDYNYITQSLKKDNLIVHVSSTRYIKPIKTVDVGSEISGTIAKIFVDYNDIVKKEDILAQLKKVNYVSLLNQAKASLHSAKAALEDKEALLFEANAIITRNERLKTYTNNALPSAKDWDSAYSNYLSVKAQVKSAKAEIEKSRQVFISSQNDLEKASIYSPIDGTILERNIDEGQTVAASFKKPVLFQIAKDLTKMELQTDIDEADIASIKAQ